MATKFQYNDHTRNNVTPDSALCLSTSSGLYSPNLMNTSRDSYNLFKQPTQVQTDDWFLMGGTERTVAPPIPARTTHFPPFSTSKSIPNNLNDRTQANYRLPHAINEPQKPAPGRYMNYFPSYHSKSMEMMLKSTPEVDLSGDFDPLEEELIGSDILREFEAVCNELETPDVNSRSGTLCHPHASQGSIPVLPGMGSVTFLRGNSLPMGTSLMHHPMSHSHHMEGIPNYHHSITQLTQMSNKMSLPSLSSVPQSPPPSSRMEMELESLMREAERKLQHYISEENIANVKERVEMNEKRTNDFNDPSCMPLEFMHRLSFISDTDYMETWLSNTGMTELRNDRPQLADTDECTLRTMEVDDTISAFSQRLTRTKQDGDLFSLIDEEIDLPPAPMAFSDTPSQLQFKQESNKQIKKKKFSLLKLCVCSSATCN